MFKTNNGLVVSLSEETRAITAGQYAVFCKDNECLGSAKILNSGVSEYFLKLDVFKNDFDIQRTSLKSCDKIKLHSVN